MTESAAGQSRPHVVIVGGGVMGGSLFSALRASGWPEANLSVVEKDPGRAQSFQEVHGVEVERRFTKSLKGAKVVVIAVKPKDVGSVLKDVAKSFDPGFLVVTLAAALPISFYEERLPEGTPVIRAMPNTPCIVAQGATALAGGANVGDVHFCIALTIFRGTGIVVKVPESELDAVTAVSGSGPAYFYAVVEALTEAGVAQGLDRELATDLAVQTFIGAARLLVESGDTPQGLRKQVSSPGGTTLAALEALTHAGLQDVISAGAKAAVARAREMAIELTPK